MRCHDAHAVDLFFKLAYTRIYRINNANISKQSRISSFSNYLQNPTVDNGFSDSKVELYPLCDRCNMRIECTECTSFTRVHGLQFVPYFPSLLTAQDNAPSVISLLTVTISGMFLQEDF